MFKSLEESALTAEYLRQILHYDPETGNFARVCSGMDKRAGSIAGSDDGHGYFHIWIDGCYYKAHSLAWLYQTGTWPEYPIYHRDGNRCNNKWSNLQQISGRS